MGVRKNHDGKIYVLPAKKCGYQQSSYESKQ